MIELVIVRAERGRYSAVLGERVLVTAKEPFFAAARILVAEGFNPDTVLTMRHQGSQTRSLTMPLGKAAGLMVKEGDVRGLEIVPYRPSPFAPIKSLIQNSESGAPECPSENSSPVIAPTAAK